MIGWPTTSWSPSRNSVNSSSAVENVISMNRDNPAPNWRIDSIEFFAEQDSAVAARVVVPTDDSVDVCLGFYEVNPDGVIIEATEYGNEHASRPTPDWRAQWTCRTHSG
ncbi:MAG: hypothetical protein ABIM89_06185 [Mycobacteriales bacterium]